MSSASVNTARTGLRDDVSMATNSAQFGASGTRTSNLGSIGIAIVKTAAAILVGTAVAIAAVASGIIGLAGLAVYQLGRK
jgi:ABC-type spermidine/putrescine transport system permease subunit II